MKTIYRITIILQIIINFIVGVFVISSIKHNQLNESVLIITLSTIIISFIISLVLYFAASIKEDTTDLYYKLKDEYRDSIKIYNETSANLARYINIYFKKDETIPEK